MNYYSHHIGDFNNATRHLTRVERSLYRDAIELYYDTESALTKDFEKLSRRLLANTTEEKAALRDVLNEFFTETDDGFTHDRCDKEIAKYRANTSNKAKAGIASAEARKQKRTGVEHVLNECETDEQLTNNHKPITNNHKPIKNIRGSRLSSDWIAPQEYIDFCNTERPDLDANFVADGFRDYWIGVVGAKGLKGDWFATWRNWVRRQEQGKSKFKNKSTVISDSQFDDWLNSGEKKAVAING
jgi:uncharacterized protein YdaU (DUF1376 family)